PSAGTPPVATAARQPVARSLGTPARAAGRGRRVPAQRPCPCLLSSRGSRRARSICARRAALRAGAGAAQRQHGARALPVPRARGGGGLVLAAGRPRQSL